MKICGIRTESDLRIALRSGADAVGFLVGLSHRSEDQLDAVSARQLVRRICPFAQAVLVTHLTEPREIVDLAGYLGVGTIQLHGELAGGEAAAVRQALPQATLIRAIHLRPEGTPGDLSKIIEAAACGADAIVVDTRTDERLGGTGLTHDWAVSARIVTVSPVPVVLAGGLTPATVSAAARKVRPFAVDVNSGVETGAGDKSPELCRQFVRNARSGRPR